jgi:hypothetical protein
LQSGAVAYLHHPKLLIAVGERNGVFVAVFLDKRRGNLTESVGDFRGNATIVNGCRIDVDYTSDVEISSLERGQIALTVKGRDAYLHAVEEFGVTPVSIQAMPGSAPMGAVAFARWRIVHGDGDNPVELFRSFGEGPPAQ